MDPEPVPVEPIPADAPPERPKITFMGNSIDLTALLALGSSLMMLLICLSCGYMIYCLPAVPLILGIIGLFSAQKSADPKRTRTWSWIGVGSGGVMISFIVLFFLLYFGVVAALILTGAITSSQGY